MEDIGGPATGEFLAALQLCQVRGYNVMWNHVPLSNEKFFDTYSLIRPNGGQRLVSADSRGLKQVLQFLEEETKGLRYNTKGRYGT